MKTYVIMFFVMILSVTGCWAEPVRMVSLDTVSPVKQPQPKKLCSVEMKEQSCSELGTIAEDGSCFCRPANAQKVVMNYQDGCRGEKIEEKVDCRQDSLAGGRWDDSTSPLMVAIWEGPGVKIPQDVEIRICYHWLEYTGELFTCFTGKLNVWYKFEFGENKITRVSVSHPELMDRDVYFRFYGGVQSYINELKKARFALELR